MNVESCTLKAGLGVLGHGTRERAQRQCGGGAASGECKPDNPASLPPPLGGGCTLTNDIVVVEEKLCNFAHLLYCGEFSLFVMLQDIHLIQRHQSRAPSHYAADLFS